MRFTVRRYDSVPTADSETINVGDSRNVDINVKVIRRDKDTASEKGTLPRRASCKEFRDVPVHVESSRRMSIGIPEFPPSICLSKGPAPQPTPQTDAVGSFNSLTADSDLSTRQRAGLDPVATRGRVFAKRQRQRLVFKDGECNIVNTKVGDRKRKYLVDIFTTLMEMRWRYNLLIFGLGFLGSWLFFALLWWLICSLHEDHIHKDDPNWTPCMANVYDFPTALLFSIETQHTIGYGFRAAEPNCTETILLLMVQSAFGAFIQSLMTGMIFAKLSRPKRRAATLIFSRNAVICQRDNEMCLLFRVGDMRKSHIVQTSIRAVMVRNKLTKEGELIPLCQFPLELETETAKTDSFVFLAWPVSVVHRINESSPLWDVSAEQVLSERFEIIVIFEGTVESTGMTTQVRTSYLPSEILWGHRMTPLLTFQKENGQYTVDHTQFHNTIPMETPEISAKQLAQLGAAKRTSSTGAAGPTYPSNFTCPAAMTPRAGHSNYTPGVFKRVRASLKRKMSEKSGRRRKALGQSEAYDSRSTSLNGSSIELNHRGVAGGAAGYAGGTGEGGSASFSLTPVGDCKKNSADSGFDPGTPTSNGLRVIPFGNVTQDIQAI